MGNIKIIRGVFDTKLELQHAGDPKELLEMLLEEFEAEENKQTPVKEEPREQQ